MPNLKKPEVWYLRVWVGQVLQSVHSCGQDSGGFAFYAMINKHQKKLGELRVRLGSHVTIHHGGSQGRNPEAGPEAEAMESYCFTDLQPKACSTCSLTEPRTTCLGVVPPTVGTESIYALQSYLEAILLEAFSQLRSPFPNGSSLCQANKT